MFARLTTQGTAAAETAICDCCSDGNKRLISVPSDVLDVSFHDCSENEALGCQVCGKSLFPDVSNDD